MALAFVQRTCGGEPRHGVAFRTEPIRRCSGPRIKCNRTELRLQSQMVRRGVFQMTASLTSPWASFWTRLWMTCGDAVASLRYASAYVARKVGSRACHRLPAWSASTLWNRIAAQPEVHLYCERIDGEGTIRDGFGPLFVRVGLRLGSRLAFPVSFANAGAGGTHRDSGRRHAPRVNWVRTGKGHPAPVRGSGGRVPVTVAAVRAWRHAPWQFERMSS